jgi:hypothetical protein
LAMPQEFSLAIGSKSRPEIRVPSGTKNFSGSERFLSAVALSLSNGAKADFRVYTKLSRKTNDFDIISCRLDSWRLDKASPFLPKFPVLVELLVEVEPWPVFPSLQREECFENRNGIISRRVTGRWPRPSSALYVSHPSPIGSGLRFETPV